MNIYFASLKYSYLFIIVPLLVILFAYRNYKKKQMLSRFMDYLTQQKLTFHIDYNKILFKDIFIIIAIIFILIAALQPQFGLKKQIIKASGLDIVFVLDVSKSMLAQDIKPNRLEKAKFEISRLVDKLKGDRVGLVIFAGSPFVQVPLTLDYAIFKMFLNAVNTDSAAVPGTNISDALKKAASLFDPKEPTSKIIILLTDGEDTSGNAVKVAKEIKKENIKIYTVGIGDPNKGALIPIVDKDGKIIDYKKDKDGNYVKTKLDTTTLRKIALETGGNSYIAGANEMELSVILDKIRRIEKKAILEKNVGLYEDRFQIFLAIGLAFLLLASFLGEIKGKIVKNTQNLIVILIISFLLSFTNNNLSAQTLPFTIPSQQPFQRIQPSSPITTALPQQPAPQLPKALKKEKIDFHWWDKLLNPKLKDWEKGLNNFYQQKYQQAFKDFNKLQLDEPQNKKLNFNKGDIYYQQGKYKEAIVEFEKALEAKDKKIKEKSYYNLGNCYYRLNKYQKALENYKKALKLNPNDKDAKYNIELIRKKMLENSKKQKQKQQQQQKKNKQQKKNNKQNNKNKKQQQQQKSGSQNKKQKQQQSSQSKQQNKNKKKQDKQQKEQKQKKKEKRQEQQKKNNKQNQKKDKNKQKQLSQKQKYSKKDLDKKEARKLLRQILEKEKENWKKRLQKQKEMGVGNYDVEKDW